MEPFTLACSTCRARLKITSEAAVGEILPCPKCGSMVMVVPPRGWQASGSGIGKPEAGKGGEKKPESATPTASGGDHASRLSMFEADLPSSSKPATEKSSARIAAAGAAGAPLIKTTFDDAASLLGEQTGNKVTVKVADKHPEQPPIQQQPVQKQPAPAKQPAANPPVVNQPAGNPPVAKQVPANATALKPTAAQPSLPKATAKAPAPATSPSAIASHASAAAASVGAVVKKPAAAPSAVAPPPRRNPSEMVQATLSGAAAPAAVPAPPVAVQSASEAAKPWFARWEVMAGGAGAIVLAVLAFAFLRGPSGEIETANESSTAAVTPVPEAPASEKPKAPPVRPAIAPIPEKTPPATIEPPKNPPAIEPKQDLPAVVQQPPVTQPPVQQPVPEKPVPLKPPVVAGPTDPPMPIDPSLPPLFDENLLKPPTKPDPKPVKVAEPRRETDLRPKMAIKPVDVPARLNDKIAGIKLKEVPLSDFTRLVSDLSTIPITLEPWALAQAGVSARQPVTIDVRDTNVEQIIKKAIDPLRLAYEMADGQLTITLPRPADGKLRKVKYSLADLLGGDAAKYELLAETITDCIAPDSWRAADTATSISVEDSSLVVEQTEEVHFQILVLCERLRIARGKPLSEKQPASKLDPAHFKLEPRWQRIEPLLARHLSVNIVRPTRLPRILETLQKETKCTILVDWRALASAGWSADTEATLADQGRTLGELLDELLGSMQLVIRPLDESTLQITTEAALAAAPEVELYSVRELVPAGGDGQALIDRLQAALPEVFRDSEIKAAHFDMESGCLILSLPANQQRQVAHALGQMKGK